MTVYEGILHGFGDGDAIETDRGVWKTRMGVTRYHKQGDLQEGWVRRGYVQVGDTRIRNVIAMPLYDEMLTEAIGEEVALSIDGKPGDPHGRHTVIALRTPATGLVKPPFGRLVFMCFGLIVKLWLGAVLLGGIVGLVGWIVLGLVGAAIGFQTAGVVIGLGLGVAVFVYCLLLPFWLIRSLFRHRGALG